MKKLILTFAFVSLFVSNFAFAAASNTVVDVVEWANGLIMEYGTFAMGGDSTLTITATTAGTYTVGSRSIRDIMAWGFASDGDKAVLPAKDVSPNQIKITDATTTDTGDYFIIGKAK